MAIVSKYTNELSGSVEDLNISEIVQPSFFARAVKDGIGELARSIKEIGLLQPIIVRIRDGHFEIVAGNRRFHACKQLGWRKVACHVIELDDKAAFEISIIENVQRQTLNPVEEALAFKSYVLDNGWGGVSELAEKLCKSPSYVSRRMKLLELPRDILDLITESEINVSSAEELTYLRDKAVQPKFATLLQRKKIPSKKIRNMIREKNSEKYSMDFDDPVSYDRKNERTSNLMDKAIIALRIAMKRIGGIAENLEGSWIFYELFMHHKNMLNSQIDLLIKEKKKSKKFIRRLNRL